MVNCIFGRTSLLCAHNRTNLIVQVVIAQGPLFPTYFDIICVENVDRCCRKVGPINCPHCQNQRIRGGNLAVTNDNQFKTNLIYQPNQPASRRGDKSF